jgi:uncharacterized membrane protein
MMRKPNQERNAASVGASIGASIGSKGGPVSTGIGAGLGGALGYIAGALSPCGQKRSLLPDGGQEPGHPTKQQGSHGVEITVKEE